MIRHQFGVHPEFFPPARDFFGILFESSVMTRSFLRLLVAVPALAFGADKPVAPVNLSDGLAVKGYDVVAYFTDGKPVKGNPQFVHDWNGAKWQFVSQEHLDLFRQNPEKYAPQYGGYCAYAVSIGKTASVSPNAWAIVDGKLYLNHSLAQGKWERDRANAIARGDKNWPEILKGK